MYRKMGDKMPPINALIKPASSSCNLQCKYCFYNDVSENREEKNYGLMSYETLEILVRKILKYGDNIVGFAFQGGEPTLAGLDFYKNLINIQEKYNIKKVSINNAIQTNGMIIDDEWAEFLAKNNFLIGLSLDGPKDIHDLNRTDIKGTGSHSRVQKTIESLNKYGVEYNILCVVTKSVARHVRKVYSYYNKNQFKYLQFIPCLDELGMEAGKNLYSLTPEIYGEFLKKLFDLWYEDFTKGKIISIRMFDNIIQMLMGFHPEACDMRGQCSNNLVIEADGSAYPCDFYVIDDYRMGNIVNYEIEDLFKGKKSKAFVEISKLKSGNCSTCKFVYLCRGGCRRHYEPIDDNKLNENYFCLAYKEFYEYSLSRFHEIVRIIERN